MSIESRSIPGAEAPKMPKIRTLENSGWRFRLRDKDTSNAAIAAHLGVQDNSDGYYHGFPLMVFYCPATDQSIVGIRTRANEVVIFHPFNGFMEKMTEIADLIT